LKDFGMNHLDQGIDLDKTRHETPHGSMIEQSQTLGPRVQELVFTFFELFSSWDFSAHPVYIHKPGDFDFEL
jgi:hypothetical protein